MNGAVCVVELLLYENAVCQVFGVVGATGALAVEETDLVGFVATEAFGVVAMTVGATMGVLVVIF